MREQNYKNHVRFVPLFHLGLSALILAIFIGSIVNVVQSWGDHERIYSASLVLAVSVALMLLFWFCRIFPLKAQDRAIRAEENLRHYVLTQKLLDARLEPLQIVALRFASDGEFPALSQRAADENMKPDAIKKAVKNWRGDWYRV